MGWREQLRGKIWLTRCIFCLVLCSFVLFHECMEGKLRFVPVCFKSFILCCTFCVIYSMNKVSPPINVLHLLSCLLVVARYLVVYVCVLNILIMTVFECACVCVLTESVDSVRGDGSLDLTLPNRGWSTTQNSK